MAETLAAKPRYAVYKEGNADCHIHLDEWPEWQKEGWQWRETPAEFKEGKGK